MTLKIGLGDRRLLTALFGLIALTLGGCATNPVTGQQELSLVSGESEMAIGKEQYAPARQSQGGDYTADPELVRYVKQVGERLAAVSDRELPYEFEVLNSSVPNAWALPGGKIALNRGLLTELNSEAELAAVLGHEIVHAAARHSAQGMERGVLIKGVAIAAGVLAAAADSRYAGLAVGATALGGQVVNQRYSREAELESDHYGMIYMQRAGYDPAAAITLQETFVRLSKGEQSNWLDGLFASHPPSQERVDKNRQLAAELGAGGERGKGRYQQKTARLKKAQPAYAAHEKGEIALQKKKPKEALSLAKKAIAIEPAEGQFYALKGDALKALGREKEALKAYDKAVVRGGDYFANYLMRGLIRADMGADAGARQDLEKSLKLLPTGETHLALGYMAKKTGDSKGAIKHFEAASEAGGKVGKAAQMGLAELDLEKRPGRYLKVLLGRDRAGHLVVQVENPTPLDLTDVELRVGRLDSSGQIYRGAKEKIELIGAGKKVQKQTQIMGISDNEQVRQYGARVTRVKVKK